MPQQRIDYIVSYVTENGKARVRQFWNEKDARDYAKQVRATRIDRTSIETIWESDELDSNPIQPEPSSTQSSPGRIQF
jgi:hypothetical protein